MDWILLIGSFFLEVIIPLVVEVLIEVGVWFYPQGFKKYDWLSLWTLCGALLGWLSSLILSYQVIGDNWAYGLHIMAGPLFCGLIIHQIGNSRQRRGKVRFRFESFWGGALFSFGFILSRLFFLSMQS